MKSPSSRERRNPCCRIGNCFVSFCLRFDQTSHSARPTATFRTAHCLCRLRPLAAWKTMRLTTGDSKHGSNTRAYNLRVTEFPVTTSLSIARKKRCCPPCGPTFAISCWKSLVQRHFPAVAKSLLVTDKLVIAAMPHYDPSSHCPSMQEAGEAKSQLKLDKTQETPVSFVAERFQKRSSSDNPQENPVPVVLGSRKSSVGGAAVAGCIDAGDELRTSRSSCN